MTNSPMNNYLSPPYLRSGDKAIIISPSGAVDSVYIDGARATLESWELNVEISAHAHNKAGRFGGTIDERLSDLQSAMDDKEAKLIFCSRGGYGIVHLLDKLNFDSIKQYPKWLVGYSDITALHLAFLKNNILSIHAPMAKHLTEYPNDLASIYLREFLFGKRPTYRTEVHELNITGEVSGRLFGGNLAVLCSLSGSDYIQVPEDGILFIEDIGERPYQIDRMIWNLKLSNVFSHIKGLIIGSFTDCEEDPLMYKPIYESIKDVVAHYKIPVAFDFPVGHSRQNYPLAHGGKINLIVNNDNVLMINIE